MKAWKKSWRFRLMRGWVGIGQRQALSCAGVLVLDVRGAGLGAAFLRAAVAAAAGGLHVDDAARLDDVLHLGIARCAIDQNFAGRAVCAATQAPRGRLG